MGDMWEVICESRGEEAFADWVIRLVSQGEAYRSFSSSPDVQFMSRDAVMTLYELLQPLQISAQIDQQGFLDMLQQNAEDLDDWVPVQVVLRWAGKFIGFYANLFRELGLEPPKSGPEGEATCPPIPTTCIVGHVCRGAGH